MIDSLRIHTSVQGFTLVELMISMGIMALMTGVLFSKYPDATTKATLASANNTLSILLHEAQLRGSSIDSGNNTLGGYGVFFDKATPGNVILFGDRVDSTIVSPQGLGIGDGVYETLPIDEWKGTTKLPVGYSYKKLCIGTTTAPLSKAPYGFLCDATSTPAISTLTISFTRPSQVANIYINGATSTNFSSACIQVYSPKSPSVGNIRSVKVYHSGMMIAGAKPCE